MSPEVDASEDIDFDDVDVDVDVDVDEKDGPGLIQDDIGDNDELLPNWIHQMRHARV